LRSEILQIMQKTIKLLLFLICSLAIASCKQSQEVQVKSQSTQVKLLGMGVEFDPHFWSQNLTRNDGSKESDWYDIVVPRVKAMDIQRFRIMLQPHWWEPFNDNDDPAVTDISKMTFDSREVLSVCKVLDLAQEQGIDVTLVQWGCPIGGDVIDESVGYKGRHFLADPDGTNWVTRCNNDEEFAENFVAFVKWLILEKGYTCIKEITPYNEPDGNVATLEQYYPTAKALDRRLKTEGLRDIVKLNLSDNIDTDRPFLEGCAANLAQEADFFNSHTYIFGYDNPNSDAFEWERLNVEASAKAGKIHFVGEFGSNLCVGASRQTDINWYKRGVLIVRNAVNFLNAGAAGASYWGLIDQYYHRNADYATMQQLGLWRYKESVYEPGDLDPAIKGDYAVRPQYFAYSLLTRFIRKGAEVHPMDMGDDFIAGTAVDNSGRWTYVIANATGESRTYSLRPVEGADLSDCNEYVYSQDTLPTDDSMIASSATVALTNGAYTVDVPAESVVLLTQL